MQKPNFLIPTKPVFVLLITCALFCLPNGAHAQNPNPSISQIKNMSPNQQRSAVIDARKKGYNLLQLEGLAKAQGATPADLLVLRNVWAQSEFDQKRTIEDNPTQPKSHSLAIKLQKTLSKNKNQTFSDALFLQTKRLPKRLSFMWLPLRATALDLPMKLRSMCGGLRKTAMR